MSHNDHMVHNTIQYIECNKCNLSFLLAHEKDIHQNVCVGPNKLWSNYFMHKGVVYIKQKPIINDDIKIPSPKKLTLMTTSLGLKPFFMIQMPSESIKPIALPKPQLTKVLSVPKTLSTIMKKTGHSKWDELLKVASYEYGLF